MNHSWTDFPQPPTTNGGRLSLFFFCFTLPWEAMERVERVGEKLFYRERKEVRVITGYHQQQKSKGV